MAAALGAGLFGGNGAQKAEAATDIRESKRHQILSDQPRGSRKGSPRPLMNAMDQKSSQYEALKAEIRRLPDLSLGELRMRWRELFGNTAPISLRRRFLAQAVAYQMQVDAFGDLSSSAKRRLREIATAVHRRDASAAGAARWIQPGTQMIRQWQKETHTVTATPEGFEWKGQTYKSLSAIARQITGTNWNGYTFFGVKRATPGNKNAAGSRRDSCAKESQAENNARSAPSLKSRGRRRA